MLYLFTVKPSAVLTSSTGSPNVIENTTFSLRCQSTGDPIPIFMLYKDGILIDRSNYTITSAYSIELVLSNVTDTANGNYQCTTINVVASVNSFLNLTIYGKSINIRNSKKILIYD